jgi:hypothetical protein
MVHEWAALFILGDSGRKSALPQGVNGSLLGARLIKYPTLEVQHYKYFPRCKIINLLSVISYSFATVTLRIFEENSKFSRHTH